MAEAKKCDKCGKLYDPHTTKVPGMSVTVKYFSEEENKIKYRGYDLCPDCVAELEMWIEGYDKVEE